MNRATKEFMDAGYVEGGIFVNIGDLLQRWSGDKLVANVSWF
jgi:isopenicillin N synthase-like dioxygenase